MCFNLMLHFSFVVALALEVRAQEVYYITSEFTECFRVASASETSSLDSAKQSANPIITLVSGPHEVGPSNLAYPPLSPANSENPEGPQLPGVVAYSMPPCAVCDCPTCTITSVFTTLLPDFGPNGPSERPYTITETYVGMSSLPNFATPTPIPYGFTTAVETCAECGAQPIIETVVTPKAGRLWGQDMAVATGGLKIQPSDAPSSPESGAGVPPDISEATAGVRTQPSSAALPKLGPDLPPAISETTGGLGTLSTGANHPTSGSDWLPDTSEATDGLRIQPSGALPPKSGPALPTGVITTFNNVGAVETTFSTRMEHITTKTQAGGQYSEVWDDEVRTSEFSAKPTSYIQISAAESWQDCLLTYCAVILAFWVAVLF